MIITELPIQEATEVPQVAVLIRFSMPVFDVPDGAPPGVAEWTARISGNELILRGHNSGGRHLKFAQLDVTAASGSQAKLISTGLTYLLAGGTMEFRAPAQGAMVGASLIVTAKSEQDGDLPEARIVIGP